MLKRLQIQNLRILENINIHPSPGMNIIFGTNGSGKTSLLEAIYIIFHGKSFRHREVVPLIKQGSDNFRIMISFCSRGDLSHDLGMQRTKDNLMIRLDGKSSIRRSEILCLLPVTWISSNPQLLLTSGPRIRRNFIDSGLFHVEHQYLTEMKKYYRALDQRNAALKLSLDTVSSWDSALHKSALEIDLWRSEYIAKLTEYVSYYMNLWSQPIALNIQYKRGWSLDADLLHTLKQSLEYDKKVKYTTHGIHRADVCIQSENMSTGKLLSRGQLKILACAFYFAQTKLIKEIRETSTVLLFDELNAELDSKNCEHLLATLNDLYSQSFITALDEKDICQIVQPDSVFHVEQGEVNW
jgi:DNA replication and repair protein RecF